MTPTPGVGTLIVPYDNMRVLLVLTCSSGQAVVSTERNDTINSNGIVLTPSLPPLIIEHAVWGPLTNAEWWVNANGSIYYWSVSLAKWPSPNGRIVSPPATPWYTRWAKILTGG